MWRVQSSGPCRTNRLEDADVSDDEDDYDWYTWPRALLALGHDAQLDASSLFVASQLATPAARAGHGPGCG